MQIRKKAGSKKIRKFSPNLPSCPLTQVARWIVDLRISLKNKGNLEIDVFQDYFGSKLSNRVNPLGGDSSPK